MDDVDDNDDDVNDAASTATAIATAKRSTAHTVVRCEQQQAQTMMMTQGL